MSRGVNKAIIIGTLGKDPEVRYTANGTAVANFSVATNESWKDKATGEMQERAEWHNLVLWGRLAEVAHQYLGKGSQAYFEGRIQTRKWQDKSGTDRYTTEIVANEMQFLGGKREHDNTDHRQPAKQASEPAPADDGFDDIPF